MDNRELGISMGALDYLVKSIEPDELIRILGSIEKENGIKINKVLIIDDDPADVEFMTALLEKPKINGRTLFKAYGGIEGVKLARKHRPDLIILDLIMPDMDGFEVIRSLRRSKKTKDIPVMIVTAKELSEEEQEFLRENIQQIILKGEYTKEELLLRIKKALERVRNR